MKNYRNLASALVAFLKDQVRPINSVEFKKKFNAEELNGSQKTRLFMAVVRKFSLTPQSNGDMRRNCAYTDNYIFPVELRRDLSTRLTPERVEILCLSERVFQKPGRRNPLEERTVEARINFLLGNTTLADAPLDLSPIPQTDEEKEIENLKAKVAQLQHELEQKQAALEKKNRLSKTGKDILEMFDLSVEELKEIVSIL